MQDRFHNEDNELKTNGENNTDAFFGGAIDENNKDNEESDKADKEKLYEKVEADGEQREDTKEEAEGDSEKMGGSEGSEDLSTDRSGRSTSSTYAPPYYVPQVTYGVSQSNETVRARGGNNTGKSSSAWVIAVSVILSIAVAICVGAVAGYFAAYSANNLTDYDKNDMGTIIKNDGRVEVNKVVQTGDYASMNISDVVATVGESVVEISTSMTKTHPYFGQYVTGGAGSGVIILQTETNVGYIVTNYHVVEGAEEITVRLSNGNEYEASYRAGDVAMDIAVIEIQVAETLMCAEIGNSDKLVVGDEVVAIGNPLGKLGGTVTNGIVSALERKIIVEDNEMVLLQTNAEINPGNSGGGLFDMGGKLIGIVNAKESAEGIEGLGFAIPINRIEKAIEDILSDDGYVKNRPTLSIGVRYGSTAYLREGLYVTEVKDNASPFKLGDRILAINGTEISSTLEYNVIVSSLEIGKDITVSVARNGVLTEFTVRVAENTSIQ